MKVFFIILITSLFADSVFAKLRITCNLPKRYDIEVIEDDDKQASYKVNKKWYSQKKVVGQGVYNIGSKGHFNEGSNLYIVNYLGVESYLLLAVPKEYDLPIESETMRAKALVGVVLNGEILFEDVDVDCLVESF